MIRLVTSALAALLFLTGTAFAQNVRPIGRTATDNNRGFTIEWPGSGFEAQFTGKRFKARIDDYGDTWLDVEVDGKASPLKLKPGPNDYVLFDGNKGVHVIKVTRRTTGLAGPTRFTFIRSDGRITPTAAPARRLLVIGDSISSGYGIEGADQTCKYSPATSNALKTFGAELATTFRADFQNIALDGRGLLRNYSGNDPTMRTMMKRTLPSREAPWNTASWIPQVIVVNLGANDFIDDENPTAAFTAAYAALLSDLRATYPSAQIFGAFGGMLDGARYTAAEGAIQTAVELRKTAGDMRVSFVHFDLPAGPGRYGCDWHPGPAAHIRMARTLQAAITNTGVWTD